MAMPAAHSGNFLGAGREPMPVSGAEQLTTVKTAWPNPSYPQLVSGSYPAGVDTLWKLDDELILQRNLSTPTPNATYLSGLASAEELIREIKDARRIREPNPA